MRDWNTLPQDRATTMLKVYELLGWPPGLLTLHRQLVVRWWRHVRRRRMLPMRCRPVGVRQREQP